MKTKIREYLERGSFTKINEIDTGYEWCYRITTQITNEDTTTYVISVYQPDEDGPVIITSTIMLEEVHTNMLKDSPSKDIREIKFEIDRSLSTESLIAVPEDNSGSQVALSDAESFSFYLMCLPEDITGTELLNGINKIMNMSDFIWSLMWRYVD